MTKKGWDYKQAIEDAEFKVEKEGAMDTNAGLQIEYDGSSMDRAKKALRNAGGKNPRMVIGIVACVVAVVGSYLYWDGTNPWRKHQPVDTGIPNAITKIVMQKAAEGASGDIDFDAFNRVLQDQQPFMIDARGLSDKDAQRLRLIKAMQYVNSTMVTSPAETGRINP